MVSYIGQFQYTFAYIIMSYEVPDTKLILIDNCDIDDVDIKKHWPIRIKGLTQGKDMDFGE